jgi:hypothetical protein
MCGIRCKKLRPATIIHFQTAIGAFKNFVGPTFDILLAEAIDADLLQNFVDSEGERVTSDTANRHLDVIGQILEFAVKRKWLLHNPMSSVMPAYNHDVDEDDDEGLRGWP